MTLLHSFLIRVLSVGVRPVITNAPWPWRRFFKLQRLVRPMGAAFTAFADQPSLGAARPFFTGWPSEACGRWSNVYDVSHLGSLWYPLDSGAFLLLKGLVRPMGDLYSRISFHRERWYLSPGFLSPQSRIFHIGMTVLCCVFSFFKGRQSEEHLKALSTVQGLKNLKVLSNVQICFFLILASATMCCWSQALSKIWHPCHSSVTRLTQLLNSVIN